MEKYYILSLNNNIYSEVENGKRINSSFDIFTKEDENSSIKMPGMGQGIILGEERDGVMYSLMPDDGIVINYVPRNEEIVDENNYQEVAYPGLSYYEKKFIPTSLAVLILSRYTKKNYLKYVNCILDLYNRNVLKYGNIVPDDEKICDIDKFKDSCEYMSEFKKRTKNIRIKK